ncbi:Spondin-1 [Cichlidogyrus casuarinus]|uniref:Spondin-1 n=1 Tax=Cichlidogyrus casuarinus TaxID=1844966 RepID=A0ABD2Q3S8_9PLAT
MRLAIDFDGQAQNNEELELEELVQQTQKKIAETQNKVREQEAVKPAEDVKEEKLATIEEVIVTSWLSMIIFEFAFGQSTSSVFGVSHSPDYVLFQKGVPASDAVKDFCTTGDVGRLQKEVRENTYKISTVIRTMNMLSSSPPDKQTRSAVFSVNKTHPMLSILSRMTPSPDWCTGISRFNLCPRDKTKSWPDSDNAEIYPWDAGVEIGNTYLPAVTRPESRRKPMCPIDAHWPGGSPFSTQKEDSTKIQSVGRIELKLIRLIKDGDCNYKKKPTSEDSGLYCTKVHWSSWSECGPIDTSSCTSPEDQRFWLNDSFKRLHQTRQRKELSGNCKNSSTIVSIIQRANQIQAKWLE